VLEEFMLEAGTIHGRNLRLEVRRISVGSFSRKTRGCGVARLHERLSIALCGALGYYLRDALQEGSAQAVACLLVPRGLFPFLLGGFQFPLPFLVRNYNNMKSLEVTPGYMQR
jgi:hypothetical protein